MHNKNEGYFDYDGRKERHEFDDDDDDDDDDDVSNFLMPSLI
jgi:hypothetical protein